MMPKVSIIILNWNGWKDTIECLQSLYKIKYPNYDVVLVDNGSDDDSVKKINEYCKGKIKILEQTKNLEKEFLELPPNKRLILIKNDENYGFAKGNNIGINYALKYLNPSYILLLNNDTIVEEKFLDKLIKVAESDKKIGIAGPKIYYYNFKGRKDVISLIGGKINMWIGMAFHIGAREVDKGQYNDVREVDYIEGSCFLIKREVIDKIGLLDTDYFAYWEESDFCIRAKREGYKCVYTPESKIWHKISSSFANPRKIYYLTKNRFRFMKKHASRIQFLTFLLYFFGVQIWLTIATSLLKHKSKEEFKLFLKAVIEGIKLIKNKL